MADSNRSGIVKEEEYESDDVPFARRHIGPSISDQKEMLCALGLGEMEQLIDETVPEAIRTEKNIQPRSAITEHALLKQLEEIGRENVRSRSFIGMGYTSCITPPVIQRNILENPSWYTQYTPYQCEIAQGRLEALLNFQTMIADLTGLEITNASLLDEGTAAAEAMAMMKRQQRTNANSAFFVSEACHPQTKAVLRTRARPMGIELIEGNHFDFNFETNEVYGCLIQYPASDGALYDYEGFCARARQCGTSVAVAADLLALTVLTPPGEFGADVAVGSAQRFGMPMGYGGPHAAFLAARDEYKRQIPGRIIGVTKDAQGKTAYRMALQTREQHIRREKATSNICTAQVLPAVVSSFYAVYHGPEGLRSISRRIHKLALRLASAALRCGYKLVHDQFFDTIRLSAEKPIISGVLRAASKHGINLRQLDSENICITMDEAADEFDVEDLIKLLAYVGKENSSRMKVDRGARSLEWDSVLVRRGEYMKHSTFHLYRSETELLRYMHRLVSRDLSLTTSMIPLGSCTMKLNATVEMMPITWPAFSDVHPFVPIEQARGYQKIVDDLNNILAEITGLSAVSLQPNSGSQGEYAGLLTIAKYHEKRNEAQRNVCLIPASAHGTNPASAVMAGLSVIVVDCDDEGNIDLGDLRNKADLYSDNLSALMVTYPSTHGVFEEGIAEICSIIHSHGGQVYMDGANMNAMVGLCRPGDFGVDVCHLNLHKTFCIPHGGGGPGMGPIAVAEHLQDFLPGHSVVAMGGKESVGAVASAPWSSASILLISWAYLRLMGNVGLSNATKVAILNANYVASRLQKYYPVLYTGASNRVAHEAILDMRLFRKCGIEVDDIAKRLMDYGFHAPTVHFPVAGTIMVEPTESESKAELDRFCDAMISIRHEIEQIESGSADPVDNVLKNAPHTLDMVLDDNWTHSYSRQTAAHPASWTKDHKFWPFVARIDNATGDRNLICTCPSVGDYVESKLP